MARVVLGCGLAHSPQLFTAAADWDIRAKADVRESNHFFRGRTYNWSELSSVRSPEKLSAELGLDRKQRRRELSLRAIDEIAALYAATDADAAIIVGNDQREIFTDDCIPALTVFWGDEIWNRPRSQEQIARLPAGIALGDAGYLPRKDEVYPGCPALARHILESVAGGGFDVAQSRTLPLVDAAISTLSGVPHAYGFVYRQVMRKKIIPSVPIILNTFFPPNQPTVPRCYAFGRAIGEAIASIDDDMRIVVFASGGLSHTVIDPEFDAAFLRALAERDPSQLSPYGEEYFQGGTSECKNWITAAGILSTTSLSMRVVGYQPLFRTAAGTGTGAAFAVWQ
jgi:Catalytic LigB subunit of aromatic ring-opening dioxygenase